MTRRVQKFVHDLDPIDAPREFTLAFRLGSKAVHVGAQGRKLCIWIEQEDTEERFVERTFVLVGTAYAIPPNARYLGTVQIKMDGYEQVEHIYQRVEEVRRG